MGIIKCWPRGSVSWSDEKREVSWFLHCLYIMHYQDNSPEVYSLSLHCNYSAHNREASALR